MGYSNSAVGWFASPSGPPPHEALIILRFQGFDLHCKDLYFYHTRGINKCLNTKSMSLRRRPGQRMDKDYFIVDFEFTQYTKPVGKPRAFFPEIIEIGAVKIDYGATEVSGHIEAFVKPCFFPKQAAESMDFCMITESDMEDAVGFGDMLELMATLYIPGKTYFISWGDADYSVVAQGCERHAFPNPILREDYLDLAAAYKAMKGDRKTTGLYAAADELGINTDGFRHTAYDDAYNTGMVLLKLIDSGWVPEHYLGNR